MMTTVYLAAVVAGTTAWIVARQVMHLARRHGLLDVPGARSSHSVPTPRGGGLGIVIGCSVAIAILGGCGILGRPLAASLLVGGGTVATVGFLDDRRSLPVGIRLPMYLLAAAFAIWYLGGLPRLQVGQVMWEAGAWGSLLALIGIVWILNLFNFMDGIDGLAASEACFIGIAAAIFCGMDADRVGIGAVALGLAMAAGGFLAWNWPPARLFMGDVGSCYIGYVLACLALADTRLQPAAWQGWILLGGVFVTDATVTLISRIVCGDRLQDAHRGHAYQRLSRHWRSHRAVTMSVIGVNLLWLSPMAWWMHLRPDLAGRILLCSLAPLILITVAIRRRLP